jgi:hypothetical protein
MQARMPSRSSPASYDFPPLYFSVSAFQRFSFCLMSWTAPLPVQRGKVVQGKPPIFGGGTDPTPSQIYSRFFIIKRPSPDDPDTIQWAVMPGILQYGDVEDNEVDIDAVADTGVSDATWNDWDGSDGEVWLECLDVDLTADGVEAQVPDVEVQATCLGGDFDPTEDDWPEDDDNARLAGDADDDTPSLQRQNLFKRWIAHFDADDDGNLIITMKVWTDLMLAYDVISGQPCIYPVVAE